MRHQFIVCAGLLFAFAVITSNARPFNPNYRPIIGILTEPSPSNLEQFGKMFIAASYVKYVESAGARVVPIRHTLSKDELVDLAQKVNGFLFPGGGVDFDNNPDYVFALNTLYNSVIVSAQKGQYLPLWGTCLGFEELLMVQTQDPNILDTGMDAENITLALNFTNDARNSKMFRFSPQNVFDILGSEPVTMNNHQCGITTDHWHATHSLTDMFTVLSTNIDRAGLEFVSTIESKLYPIYGTQWHPEKPMFEWRADECMNHSADSVLANMYMSQFFVGEARRSHNSFPTDDEEYAALIYNYSPTYTYHYESSYEQCYFFDE